MSTKPARASGQGLTYVTRRTDWDPLIVEVFKRVVAGVPFGLGVVALQKTLLGTTLRPRFNQSTPHKSAADYIRTRFKGAEFDRVFAGEEGLERDASVGLYKVTGDNLGLPKNCLLARIENPANANYRAVVVFGGERLEGQLEQRLKALEAVLGGGDLEGGGTGKGVLMALDSREKLVAALGNLNIKRLFDYDLDLLARIVNGLEETKDDLPKALKPKFKSASDYIIKKRLKR